MMWAPLTLVLVANKWLHIIGVPVKDRDNDGIDTLKHSSDACLSNTFHLQLVAFATCRPGMSIDHTQKGRSVATVSIHGCVLNKSRRAYFL